MARRTTHTNKESKTAKVLDYLQKHGSITTWEAIEHLGVTRLSAAIYQLRKYYTIGGIDEVYTDRFGNTSVYTRYILGG